MSDASDRIKESFAEDLRDVTPATARHAALVLFTPVLSDAEMSRHCSMVLSEDELKRRDRFADDCDRARFGQRRAFRRLCGATAIESSRPLSEIVFKETENGRPYLSEAPEMWFSFSSCPLGFLGAWSLTHAIGVDIEDQTRDLEANQLARQFFSVPEAESVEEIGEQHRLRTFYQFWSLKEAALKSIGEGLPYGLDAFQFELDPTLRVVHAPPEHGGRGRFDAYMLEETDSCAALVIRS